MSVWRRALRHLRPPPKLTPSEWAELHVQIPAGNFLPGPVRFANAPYQRQPLDMMADPDCRQVTLMWGAQVGKTQILNCAMAYFIAHKPVSQIIMQPSQGDLQTWLQTKLQPLIDTTPIVRAKMAKPRARKGVNNERIKSYPGGWMMFSWSGSPKTMRQRSAPKIYCDEVDGYEVTAEGHPVSLLKQRSATFGDQATAFVSSTPTIKGASYVESSFLSGDQRRFWIECPHCREWLTLKWEQIAWSKDPDTGEDLPDTAAYHCQHCGCAISDGQKVAAVRRGEWRAEKPYRGHASYHLSELYSPFRKWREIVARYIEMRDTDDLQTFTNVSLAETWAEAGEQAMPEQLMARAEEYLAPVPMGAVYLTAGIDMQTDRLEVEVVGWGVGEESWSIEYRVLWGDPLGADVWEDLEEYLGQTWQHESGAILGISASALDTGGTEGYTQAAYEWVRRRGDHKLYAIKGFGGWGRPIAGQPAKRKSGERSRRINLHPVGVDEAKVVVMRRLLRRDPGPGYCHFPTQRHPEWYQQLAAEKLVTKIVKGAAVREWHQVRDRNEALDCRVYALAALKISNVDLRRVQKRLLPGDVDAPSRPAPQPPTELVIAPEMTPEVAEPAKSQRKWKKRNSSPSW